MASVEEMLKHRLAELSADGLVNPSEECGCGLDDLAPCESLNLDCVVARWIPKSEADPEILALQDDDAGYFEAISGAKP